MIDPPSDNTTLLEVLADLRRDGYTTDFIARPGGHIRCPVCQSEIRANQATIHRFRRLEGASDPDDMLAVLAIECSKCHDLGTLVLKFGPDASPEDVDVLQDLPPLVGG